MGLPSQRSDDDGALVEEITRSIEGADDPKKVRSLLNAWWRYAGVRAAAGAEVDAEKFLAERSSLGLLELPLPAARGVIELEYAIANGPQGALPVVPTVDQSRVVDRPMSIVPLPAPPPEPEIEEEPEVEPEPVAATATDEAELEVEEPELEAEVETEPEYDGFEGEFEGAFEGEFEYLPEPGSREPVASVAPLGAEVEHEQPVADEAPVAAEVADEQVAELDDEPTGESELDSDPEDEDDALDEELEDDADDADDEPVAAVPPALALLSEPEPEPESEIEAELEAESEPEIEETFEPEVEPELEAEVDQEFQPEFEPEPEYKLEPVFIAPAAAAVLQPIAQPEPEIEHEPDVEVTPEPEADAAPAHVHVDDEQEAPIPVAALLGDHDLVDRPEEWDALDEPVPISHFERFRRDRADRTVESTERAKISVYAGLVVFFSVAIGTAMALSLVVTHISLPGSDAAAIVAPWRAWLAVVTGVAGVVVATVIARRQGLGKALVGPRIGLGGLAVTGLGLLAGSLIAAGAGGLVLLGGAALGAVRRG